MGLIVTHLSRRESKACCGEWGMETWKWGTLEDPGGASASCMSRGQGSRLGWGLRVATSSFCLRCTFQEESVTEVELPPLLHMGSLLTILDCF